MFTYKRSRRTNYKTESLGGKSRFQKNGWILKVEILWVESGWWGAARFLGGGGPHQQYAPVGANSNLVFDLFLIS